MTEVARAQDRARRLYPKSKAFQGVYMAGVRAAIAGRSIESCPYKADSKGTWRRSYRRAWLRGFKSVSTR